jgi:hypothetical protein
MKTLAQKGTKIMNLKTGLRPSQFEPPRSRRPKEAIPAPLPRLWPQQLGASERPVFVVIQNPPPHVGGCGTSCGGAGLRWNVLKVAKRIRNSLIFTIFPDISTYPFEDMRRYFRKLEHDPWPFKGLFALHFGDARNFT